MAHTRAELIERYNNLPEDIKTVLESIEMIDEIIKIADKHNLHIDQQGELANEIGLVFLGATKTADFLRNVEQRLKVSPAEAGEIVKEVNGSIFFPIREALERLNEGNRYTPATAPKVEHFSPAGNLSPETFAQPKPAENKDNQAVIIGETAPLESQPKKAEEKIFDQKMGKLFHLPKNESDLGQKENPPLDQPPVDPYREQIF